MASIFLFIDGVYKRLFYTMILVSKSRQLDRHAVCFTALSVHCHGPKVSRRICISRAPLDDFPLSSVLNDSTMVIVVGGVFSSSVTHSHAMGHVVLHIVMSGIFLPKLNSRFYIAQFCTLISVSSSFNL